MADHERLAAAAAATDADWKNNVEAARSIAQIRAPLTGHGAELQTVIALADGMAPVFRDSWWLYLSAMCHHPRKSQQYRLARKQFDSIARAAAIGSASPDLASELLRGQAEYKVAARKSASAKNRRLTKAQRENETARAHLLAWRDRPERRARGRQMDCWKHLASIGCEISYDRVGKVLRKLDRGS